MKAYLDFVNKIAGYEDVLETVGALEKISASSIHQLKTVVNVLDRYTDSIRAALFRLQELGIGPPVRKQRRDGQTVKALLILGGEQGLVGGLYHALLNTYLARRSAYSVLWVVGSKIESYLEEEGLRPAKAFPGLSANPTESEMEDVAQHLFRAFGTDFESLDILYASFVSLAEQKPKFVPYLPFSFDPSTLAPASSEAVPATGFPIYDPGPEEAYQWFLAKYTAAAFRKIALESKLSELSARTVSSEQAAEKTRKTIHAERRAFSRAREQWLNQTQLERFSVQTSL